MHTYIVYSHTYIQMYACIYMYVYACMCVCMCVYVCVYVCMCNVYVYAYMYMYVCIIYWGKLSGGKCPTQNGRGNCPEELSRGIVRGNCPGVIVLHPRFILAQVGSASDSSGNI